MSLAQPPVVPPNVNATGIPNIKKKIFLAVAYGCVLWDLLSTVTVIHPAEEDININIPIVQNKGKPEEEAGQVAVDGATNLLPARSEGGTAGPLTTEQKAENFYRRHYESLDLNHTKGSDLLSWVTKNTGGPAGPGFLDGILKSIDHYAIFTPPVMKKSRGRGANIVREGEMNFSNVTAMLRQNMKEQSQLLAMEIPTKGQAGAKHVLHFPYKSQLCKAAKFFQVYRQHPIYNNTPWPHIAFIGMHRDFGALSQYLEGQTYTSNFRTEEWKKQGCSIEFIQQYLDHPDTVAVITTQYHMFYHPKAHSIPLGMQGEKSAMTALKYLSQKGGRIPPAGAEAPKPPLHERPQLLMVNFKDWRQLEKKHTRHVLTQHLQSPDFAHPNGSRLEASNTYVKAKTQNHTDHYYAQLLGSKFIVSPSGWGIDCYRNWEALYVGTIPVLETGSRKDGWFHTFDDLPVAWISKYTEMTPQWLEKEYIKIIDRWDSYNWEKMKRHWWVDWVKSLISGLEQTPNQ